MEIRDKYVQEEKKPVYENIEYCELSDDVKHGNFTTEYVEWLEERANVWISVEDELPPLDQPVWLFEKGRISIGFRTIFNMDGWFWSTTYDYADYRPSIGWDMCPECDDDYKPTHWQPLPTPPKQQ
jgi:hypothetical protein